MEEKKISFLNKSWNYINGHKTVIFMTVSTMLQQAVNYNILPDSDIMKYTIGLTMTFGGGSLFHHVKKARAKNKFVP